jgi:hypothetical protein
MRLMEAGKLRDARAAVDAARKDFPALPGLEVLSASSTPARTASSPPRRPASTRCR